MSEISLQAVQLEFTPRLVVVVILLALTWLIAKFAKYMVLRATCQACTGEGIREKMARMLANLAFGSVFLVMMPFIINALGLNPSWLYSLQNLEAEVFINWPVWMILSLVAAGIGFVVRGIPKVFVQLKGSAGTTRSEV